MPPRPNDDTIIRLVGARMPLTDDQRIAVSRYMSLEALARVPDQTTVRLLAVGT